MIEDLVEIMNNQASYISDSGHWATAPNIATPVTLGEGYGSQQLNQRRQQRLNYNSSRRLRPGSKLARSDAFGLQLHPWWRLPALSERQPRRAASSRGANGINCMTPA
ncbi:MAG TPA: hypothetical protein IGS52_03265 [Oscillatoriaceae cyanobacterium M33_DOE_052]|uniref:Uncharacterized protein n=1 Tax=Planktothricoides sp. SpSt-374 TaxID=2282167 RepID=A0A7C3VSS1_9CYAN|nr:hypothetical protein [Oscillatoriaceae cyanobacterium M33_DOE_052]